MTYENLYKYANRIRNSEKRSYAIAYIAWLEYGKWGPAPEPDKYQCSAMAKQAVRMQIVARGGGTTS